MKGWKTWLAVAGLCGLGVYLIQMGEKEFGMMCILNGLGLVGIGSKVDKVGK
jgi:hypothetical protein